MYQNICLRIISVIVFLCLWMNGYNKTAITTFFTVGCIVYYKTIRLVTGKLSSKDAIIITGCDSGLGYGLALHCQSLGATVFAAVHSEHSSGAIKLKDSQMIVLPLDITNQRNLDIFCTSVARTIKKNNLKLKAVVNNVGVMVFGEFEWQTEDQMLYQINVNLIGTMKVTKRLLPLIRSEQSRLIFVCSHCALEPLPGVAVYSATKAGLLAYATSLRVELGKYNIPVISFIPGSFVTESNILAKQKEYFQEMRNNMSDEVKEFYSDYFNRYEKYLVPISQTVKPAKLSNKQIFDAFENCLFDFYPAAIYKSEPWRYTVYHLLCKISPTTVRDYLIEKFVCMPKWKKL